MVKTKIYFNLLHYNVFNFMKSSKCYRYSQKIISKFFWYYYYSSKEEFRGSCCSRIIYMTWKNKHWLTTVFEGTLFDLYHHIARLAWLIQEYLAIFSKKVIRINTENSVEVRTLCHITTHLVLFIQVQSNSWPAFSLL